MPRCLKLQQGFGLAEVLLASGVLILVVASVVALSRFIVRGYSLTSSRTQALYLAQEGVEEVRDIRDSYWIDGCPATDFTTLPRSGTFTTKWNQNPSVTDCSNIPPRWELVPSPSPESITLGVNSATFQRLIQVSAGSVSDSRLDPNIDKVTVTVTWTEAGVSNSVSVDTFLTNWSLES